MRRPAVAVLTNSVSSLPDPQQHQTLYDYLEATARQLHGAVDPATPMTADAYAVAELEALQQAQTPFPDEITKLKASKPVAKSSRLMSLAPELDKATELTRVGGRLCRSSDLTSDAIHLPPKMADLPPTRQQIFKPAFYSTGVDFFSCVEFPLYAYCKNYCMISIKLSLFSSNRHEATCVCTTIPMILLINVVDDHRFKSQTQTRKYLIQY